MPKTPGQNETVRSNPFITKGISRNLLTPCRQVGLSRKRRTPANSGSHSSQIEKVNNNSYDNLQTTPVSSNVSSIHEVEANKSNIESTSTSKQKTECLRNQKTDKKKTKVSKRLIADNEVKEPAPSPVPEDIMQIGSRTSSDEMLNCVPLDNEECIIKTKSESVTSKVKNKKKRWLDSDEDDFAVNDDKTEKKITCLDKDESNVTKELVVEISENPTVAESVVAATKDIKLINEHSKRERQTFSREERQMKNNTEKNSKIKPQVVLLDKTNKDGTEPQKTKKMKRSLSLKKSSEDDSEKKSQTKYLKLKECSMSLSPVKNSSINSEICLNGIQDLEKQVKEKQKTVENFRQAEIYKKKHNVQELQELTSQWKSGCISALNDLLPQLQTHATIDMATLLNNLRIPENLISLSQSGELC